MTVFNIENQNGDRPVRIIVTPATESANANSDGLISINDLITNDLIYNMPTSRTTIPSVWYGDTLQQAEFTIDAEVYLDVRSYSICDSGSMI